MESKSMWRVKLMDDGEWALAHTSEDEMFGITLMGYATKAEAVATRGRYDAIAAAGGDVWAYVEQPGDAERFGRRPLLERVGLDGLELEA